MAHHHGHGCSSEECDHSEMSDELGIQYSLYQKIMLDNVECLNEAVDGSGKTVFRAWEDRLAIDKVVESDADEELLFNIPFTGLVKLKGIIVIGGNEESHPAAMRLFKNRPNMTFDDARMQADQEFEMTRDPNGTLEYATKSVLRRSGTVRDYGFVFPMLCHPYLSCLQGCQILFHIPSVDPLFEELWRGRHPRVLHRSKRRVFRGPETRRDHMHLRSRTQPCGS